MSERPLRIYLSGSIKKGRADTRGPSAFWTPEDEEYIRASIGGRVELLNPAKSPIKRGDYFANYGCDLYLVSAADLVLVDLRGDRGIGVGAELMFAQLAARCVVGWLPPETNYKRALLEDVYGENLENWIHPFAYGLCDHLVENLDEACLLIRELVSSGRLHKDKGKSTDNAIRHFLAEYPELEFD